MFICTPFFNSFDIKDKTVVVSSWIYKMAAAKVKSNSRAGNLPRSRSEGTLIDIDENVTINNNNLHGKYAKMSPSLLIFQNVIFAPQTYFSN